MLENTLRLPPQNLEAEQALLGAILSNNRALEKVTEFLHAECFSNPIHGKIYEICRQFIEQGRIADPITIKAYFKDDEALKNVGGADYLAELAAASTNIINAHDYGRQILDCYIRRQMIALGTDIVNDAFDIVPNEEAVGQIELAEKRLYEIAVGNELSGGPKALKTALDTSMETLQEAMNSPNGLSGVTTGLSDVDDILSGLHNSDLLILAGRPGMGKSAMALTIAYNAAVRFEEENKKEGAEKKSVAFFSLEMSAEQLASRILSAKAQIPGDKMRSGKINEEQFEELMAGSSLLCKLPLFIDETSGITVSAIKNRARRLKRDKEKGLGLIVIDYLQLISSSTRSENRVQELSEMTRQLKIMAKELNVPVLVLSQLSRLVEQRDNKRPQLSDLRESGSIEQDADVVMFVFREHYYLKNDKPIQRTNETADKYQQREKAWQQQLQESLNTAELIIAKHRHGKTATVPLYFNGEFGKFGNLQKASK